MCDHYAAYERRTIFNTDDLNIGSEIQPRRGRASIVRGRFCLSSGSEITIKRIPRVSGNSKAEQEQLQDAALRRELAVWCTLGAAGSNVLELLGTVAFSDQNYLPLSPISHYYENGDLITHLGTPRSHSDRLELIKGVAAGVAYIHGHNIVHGDLKR
ncbi:hypothetical protein FRC08_006666, partial [Ceratobasidium sp. 394]